MSKVVLTFRQLEEQLRKDGYKGVHKAMRHLKTLRILLQEEDGYSFESVAPSVKEATTKGEETFTESLDSLV